MESSTRCQFAVGGDVYLQSTSGLLWIMLRALPDVQFIQLVDNN